MYGTGTYGHDAYASEHVSAAGEPVALEIHPPLVINAFQVFAPESVAPHGRPLAEDIRIMSVKSSEAEIGFHTAFGESLYPSTIERERRVLFGKNATCTLYAVSPGAGQQEVIELTTGWMARRIPTIESGGAEPWRLEVVDNRVDWNMLKYVTKVRLRGATDEEQTYEVSERYNAMKPGKVYHIHMQAICNFDPS